MFPERCSLVSGLELGAWSLELGASRHLCRAKRFQVPRRATNKPGYLTKVGPSVYAFSPGQ